HAEARAAAAGGPAILHGACRGRLTVARAGGGGGRRRRRTRLRGRGTVLVPAAVRCVAVRGPGLRRHRGGRRAGLGQDPLRLRGMLVLDEQFVLHRDGGRHRGEVPLTPGHPVADHRGDGEEDDAEQHAGQDHREVPGGEQEQQQPEEEAHPQARERPLGDHLRPGAAPGDALHELQVGAHDQGALHRELLVREGVDHRLHLLVRVVHAEGAGVLEVVEARCERGGGTRWLAHAATVVQALARTLYRRCPRGEGSEAGTPQCLRLRSAPWLRSAPRLRRAPRGAGRLRPLRAWGCPRPSADEHPERIITVTARLIYAISGTSARSLRCAGRTAPSRGLWTSSVSMMKEEPMYDDTQDSILETPAERLGASRRLFLGLAGAGTGAAALSACAAGGGGGDDEGGGSGVSGGDGEVSDDNPFGGAGDAAVGVVIFNGRHGDQYAKDAGEKYAEMYPDADVKVSSTVNIQPDLQPRFIGGNPPDLFDNSGAQSMNAGALVGEGSVAEIDQLLEAPSL